MKRIRVPEGMIRCAVDATCDFRGNHYEPAIRPALEAALLWLSEHPQVPTDEQLHEFYAGECEAGVSFEFLQRFSDWWQRRCFVQEEPEIPEEIKDLLCANATMDRKERNERILEAYRRGLTRGSVALRKGEQK